MVHSNPFCAVKCGMEDGGWQENCTKYQWLNHLLVRCLLVILSRPLINILESFTERCNTSTWRYEHHCDIFGNIQSCIITGDYITNFCRKDIKVSWWRLMSSWTSTNSAGLVMHPLFIVIHNPMSDKAVWRLDFQPLSALWNHPPSFLTGTHGPLLYSRFLYRYITDRVWRYSRTALLKYCSRFHIKIDI